MKKLAVLLLPLASLLLGASSESADAMADHGGEDLATGRKVHGIITAVEPAQLTIASAQRAVTGKIDPLRTRVTVNGKPAKVADLQLTAHAKAEICLEDVWLAIDIH